ncbi:MAG: scramblase [Phycisphaerae bacterium]|nr:scramblase [Phycisphaerae bacterium]
MSDGAMETYVVRQKKEWGEILTGFECRNRYVITDPEGRELYYAAEVGGSTVGRLFLKSQRAWTIHILDAQQQQVLQVRRPFRFYFHEAEIRDGSGALLGTIKRRWSWLRRLYTVYDEGGREAEQLFGPILHPWTFEIRRDGETFGKVSKKWSGLGKEMFTKADNFAVSLPSSLETGSKSRLLGAVFLIDFVHFERSNN